jgi:UDPglucose--hexose-1-phosphate uridylyltransferase
MAHLPALRRRTSFPYSMGIHQRPLPPQNEREEQESPAHLHIHFYPPLLRSASVRKFLVGFEMMGEAQVSGAFPSEARTAY